MPQDTAAQVYSDLRTLMDRLTDLQRDRRLTPRRRPSRHRRRRTTGDGSARRSSRTTRATRNPLTPAPLSVRSAIPNVSSKPQ